MVCAGPGRGKLSLVLSAIVPSYLHFGRTNSIFLIRTTARSSAAHRRGGGFEPGARRRIDERCEAAGDVGVVAVEPAALFGGQQVSLDEPPVDRR